MDHDVTVQVILERVVSDRAGVVEEELYVGQAEILTVGIDRRDLAAAHAEIDPVVTADVLGEAAGDVRTAINRGSVEDMDIIYAYAFVSCRGIAVHHDPEAYAG